MTTERTLEQLKRLVGNWALEATHPAAPGLVVRGTAEVTWLEGERFLIHRARLDFPDSIAIIGFMESTAPCGGFGGKLRDSRKGSVAPSLPMATPSTAAGSSAWTR